MDRPCEEQERTEWSRARRTAPTVQEAGTGPPLSVSPCCCRAAARLDRIRPASMKRWPRPEPSSRLGRRHLDRRDQLGADRRQSARSGGSRGCAPSGRRSATLRSALRTCAEVAAGHRRLSPRFINQLGRSSVLLFGALTSSRRAFPTHAAAVEPGRCGEPLRHRSAAGHARASWSISIASIPAALRFSVGAVNVQTGNFVSFDNTMQRIGPEHIMASGSLPPGFPATEIDGEYFWDGGLVSNTPLQWVLDDRPRQDTLAFQVDLWNARGELPRDLIDAEVRQKEIQLFQPHPRRRPIMSSGRSSFAWRSQTVVRAAAGRDARPRGRQGARRRRRMTKVYNIVHLIYRSRNTRALPRTTSSPAGPWRSIGRPATTTPRARCSHPEVLAAARPAAKASAPSTSMKNSAE